MKSIKKWLAAAAVFVIMLTAVVVIATSLGKNSGTVIAFDVNPSLEIKVDKNEKLISVTALNSDGEEVIKGLTFENDTLESAVDKIITSMLEKNYLSELQNSILVSVDTGNEKDAERLGASISETIAALLGASNIEASVMTQSYHKDKKTNSQAEANGISAARASLINKIIDAGLKNADGVAYTAEQLARLNVNELKLILESKGINVTGLGSSGKASDGRYIGAERALEIALAKAGFTKENVTRVKVELDFDDDVRRMVYEVEFINGEYEYEYDIDAVSEKIIDEEIDFDDDHDNDYEDNNGRFDYGDEIVPEGCISKEEAVQKALAHANIKESDVKELECDFDIEFFGRSVFEIDFEAGGYEYEYKINAKTGEIIKSHVRRDY